MRRHSLTVALMLSTGGIKAQLTEPPFEEHVCGNYLKEMVGRDGIEPPTPGFSGLEMGGTIGHYPTPGFSGLEMGGTIGHYPTPVRVDRRRRAGVELSAGPERGDR
jgi:hypothetical protein